MRVTLVHWMSNCKVTCKELIGERFPAAAPRLRNWRAAADIFSETKYEMNVRGKQDALVSVTHFLRSLHPSPFPPPPAITPSSHLHISLTFFSFSLKYLWVFSFGKLESSGSSVDYWNLLLWIQLSGSWWCRWWCPFLSQMNNKQDCCQVVQCLNKNVVVWSIMLTYNIKSDVSHPTYFY